MVSEQEPAGGIQAPTCGKPSGGNRSLFYRNLYDIGPVHQPASVMDGDGLTVLFHAFTRATDWLWRGAYAAHKRNENRLFLRQGP
jgi:hypothetical protein